MPANLENLVVPTGLERSVFIPIPKKGNAKEYTNYCTIALISQASKVMLKILQARLQQYMNCELPDVQPGFRKGRGTRDWFANIPWIIKKSERVPEKHLLLLYWLCQSLWLYGSQQTVMGNNRDGKYKEIGIPDHLTCLWRNLYAGQEATVRSGHGTGSKLGKEYIKSVYCHPAYLTYMQSTSWEMLGWMKYKLVAREISITSDMQMTSPLWQNVKKSWRASWWKWRGEWKSWLKAQH